MRPLTGKPGPRGAGSTHQQQLLRENGLPGFRHSCKVGAEETLISFPLAPTPTTFLSSGVTVFCNWASLQHVQSKETTLAKYTLTRQS